MVAKNFGGRCLIFSVLLDSSLWTTRPDGYCDFLNKVMARIEPSGTMARNFGCAFFSKLVVGRRERDHGVTEGQTA